METLQSQIIWDVTRARQAEMLQEAKMAHLARMAQKPRQRWWNVIFRRQAPTPTLALKPSAAPELG